MEIEIVIYATTERLWRKLVVNSEEPKMRNCTEPTETNFKGCSKCIYCSTSKDSLRQCFWTAGAPRYRALASIIPGRERFSSEWQLI